MVHCSLTAYFICMCYQLPVTKATRDGTYAIRQAFLPSGQATVVFFLASLLWQQEIHDQQNPSPCHQFLHKDSGTIQSSLGLSINLFLLTNLDMFSLLVDCTSSQCTQHISKSEEENVHTDSQTSIHRSWITINECICYVEGKNLQWDVYFFGHFSL